MATRSGCDCGSSRPTATHLLCAHQIDGEWNWQGAIQMLCAAHAIPLNDLASPVTITTGRALRDSGWPEGATTIVVVLDAGGAFRALDPAGLMIWWGAYVGMAEQILRAGPLAQVQDDILATRATARAAHGWIMDIYLIRKT